MRLVQRSADRQEDSTPPDSSAVDVSIVVVSWNTRDVLLECLDSLRAVANELSVQIVVVDNASTDGTVEAVRERYDGVEFFASRRNSGFGRANNRAFRHCRGRYLLLLNPDATISVDAVKGLVEFMDTTPDAGAAGLQLVYPNDRLQNSYDNFPTVLTQLVSKHLLRLLFPSRFPSKRQAVTGPMPVDVVIGACLVLRAEIARELQGFDENYFLFVEETDLCRRIHEAGWKVYHLPHLRIYHGDHHSQAQAPGLSTLESYRSTFYYFKKHSGLALAMTFRVLMTLKLVVINMSLSLIATTCTLGTVPRHVRRLRMRAVLSAWHLCGCPDSWGMRLVSDYRGFERQRDGGVLDRSERIVPDDATSLFREFARNPAVTIARGKVVVESRSTTLGGEDSHNEDSHIEDIVVSFPGPVDASSDAIGESSEPVVLLRVFRPRWKSRLLSFWRVSEGVLAFDDALDNDDMPSADGGVIAAGVLSSLGFHRYSFVAYRVRERAPAENPGARREVRVERGASREVEQSVPGSNGSNGSSAFSSEKHPDGSRRS